MPINVQDLISDLETLEALEPYEVGHALLQVIAEEDRHVNPGNVITAQAGKYGARGSSEYVAAGPVLSEGWAWLVNQGLLVLNPAEPHGNWFILSRAGQALATTDDVGS